MLRGDSSLSSSPTRNERNCGVRIFEAWGMAPPPKFGGPPVTNIRNTSSPHWRGRLKPENRCLVLFNSFAEYVPEAKCGNEEKGRRLVCPQRGLAAHRLRPSSGATALPSPSLYPALTWSTAS